MKYIKQRGLVKGGLYLFGLVIMLWLFSRVPVHTAIQILHHTNYIGIFIAMIVFITLVLLRGWKWYFLTRRMELDFNFIPFITRYIVYYFYSAITPLRSGEVFAPYAVSSNLKHRSILYRSLIVDRFIDTMILGLLSMLSIFYLFDYTKWVLAVKLIWFFKIGIGFIIIGALIYFITRIRFPAFFSRITNKLKIFLQETGQFLREVHPKWIAVQIGMSLIMWLLDLSFMYIVMKSVGLNHMVFIHSAACQIGATVASVLTLVPAGIGTGETSYTFLCTPFHYSQELLIMGSILSKLLFILIIAILHLIGYWLIHITRIKK